MGQVVMVYVAGNLPPGVTQGDIDRVFGRPLSDMAEEELSRQHRIQAAVSVLRDLLDAAEGEEALPTKIDYDPLRMSLHNATISERKLQDIICDADDELRLCKKADAAERLAESRQDAEGLE